LRLLLDEMYPASVAEGLRGRGHDAVAVVERPELRNVPDPELFTAAQAERRAVVTENLADFVAIANDCDGLGMPHHGIVFVHPRRYPRARQSTIGAMVTALAELAERTTDEQPTSLRHWL
jgi:Domain of unknown function (DUF5615)